MKRILFLADTHCGHRSGLTPPDYQYSMSGDPIRRAWAKLQRDGWKAYMGLREEIGSPDIVVGVGDLIEGDGDKNNGTELITTDRLEQARMASQALKVWDAKTYIIVRGTPSHAGQCEDFEDVIAARLNGQIRDRAYIKVEGIVFDVCHHLSVIKDLKTRATPLSREKIENLLRWERAEAPKADIFIRAHTHMYCNVGGHNWEAFSLPALQMETKYGVKRARNICDWGLLFFDIDQRRYTWQKRICRVKTQTEPMIVIS